MPEVKVARRESAEALSVSRVHSAVTELVRASNVRAAGSIISNVGGGSIPWTARLCNNCLPVLKRV